MTKLETDFTKALIGNLQQAETVTGVAETRLMTQAQQEGGPKAVKQLLGRGRQTRQFAPLREKQRLDLTPEALVAKGKYAGLFTDEEVNLCLQTLLEAGFY
jgi:hypothetical protein